MSFSLRIAFCGACLGLGSAGCRPNAANPALARPAEAARPSVSASPVVVADGIVARREPPCSRKPSTEPAPPLTTIANLPSLLDAGASGAPERVRLRFHHPISGCGCPSFAVTDYESEAGDDGFVQPWTYAVFPKGAPNGHAYESGKFLGATEYQLTGYFSGRLLDYYEFLFAQNGERASPFGGEDESDRTAEYPEFCVEDWCFVPDPDPVLHKDVMSPKEIAVERREYQRLIATMKLDGAKVCARAPKPREQ